MLFQGFYCMGRKSLELKQKQNTSFLNVLTSCSGDERRREQRNVQPNFISATTNIDHLRSVLSSSLRHEYLDG